MIEWQTKWRCAGDIRQVVYKGAKTMRPKLQQLWVRDTLNGWGHVNGYEEEWRDVPVVIGEDING